jgi:hypothetical protein
VRGKEFDVLFYFLTAALMMGLTIGIS